MVAGAIWRLHLKHTYGSTTYLFFTLSQLLLYLLYDFHLITRRQYDRLSHQQLHFLFSLPRVT